MTTRMLERGDLIVACATILQLPQPTMATALFYFHQYHIVVDEAGETNVSKLASSTVSAAALSLACKQTEAPRKLRDIINSCYWVSHRHAENGTQYLKTDEQRYWDLRSSVISAEHILLRCLSFNTTVDCPYPWILTYAFTLYSTPVSRNPELSITGEACIETSWSIANTILLNKVSARFSGKVIALVCMYLGGMALAETEEWPSPQDWLAPLGEPASMYEEMKELMAKLQ
ncbi:cyclin-like protein [Chytridium lagenaria]|nr:cyclin-like protein [Chytridium lagenaria]